MSKTDQTVFEIKEKSPALMRYFNSMKPALNVDFTKSVNILINHYREHRKDMMSNISASLSLVSGSQRITMPLNPSKLLAIYRVMTPQSCIGLRDVFFKLMGRISFVVTSTQIDTSKVYLDKMGQEHSTGQISGKTMLLPMLSVNCAAFGWRFVPFSPVSSDDWIDADRETIKLYLAKNQEVEINEWVDLLNVLTAH